MVWFNNFIAFFQVYINVLLTLAPFLAAANSGPPCKRYLKIGQLQRISPTLGRLEQVLNAILFLSDADSIGWLS